MNSDAELIARVAQGDRRAFEPIVERYEKTVFNAAYRIVANHEDAADITQTVFLKVYQKAGKYDPKHKFFSWLYRIAVNEAINYAKRRSREMQLDADFAARDDTPVERAVHNEASDRIQEALKALKPDYRVVIVLKYFLELSYKEISDIAGIPEKTVKSRLFTGRKLLRDTLIEGGYAR